MQTTSNPLEARTRHYGRELFARLDRSGPLPFTPAWLDDRLMEISMSDPTLKVQLFRFVDSLPLLKSSDAVAGHLREYLEEARPVLPWFARTGMHLLPRQGLAGQFLSWTAQWNARRLARRFIAGSNVDEALEAVARMRQRQLGFTIDLLGEATITEGEAEAVQQQYLELIAGLTEAVNHWPSIALIDHDHRGPIPRVNISVKLTALFSQFDPIDPIGTSAAVRARLRPILRLARQQRAFVNFDMEQYAYKDLTLRIFREILLEEEFRDWPDVGIAIQAYLRDTFCDLEHLLAWTHERGAPVWVRLVKGAYWDFETVHASYNGWPTPVFTEKWQSDAAFERCARLLMENYQQLRPAFGSHNLRSIAATLAMAEEFGVPEGAYEYQMLYGMADQLKDVLLSLNRRVRIYTPYGELLPGMAYLVRRLLENTSNESFLRVSVAPTVSEEQLFMNPTLHAQDGSPTPNGLVKKTPEPAVDPATGLPSFVNEPLTDFSKEANQAKLRAAIEAVNDQLGQTYPVVINGENQPTAADRLMDSLNPSMTRQVVGWVAKASIAQAEAAIHVAKQAFPGWRDTDAQERADALRRLAELMRRRKFELAAWEVLECAKPWREADADVAEAIDFCEYYAREMLRFDRPIRMDMPGEDNEMFYEPRGVTVVIAPWNFPLAILCGMTTAALVAGNTVIMKPAEQSSVVGAKLMEMCREAEIPPGVVQFLPGIGEEIGPTLVNHPDVAVVAFTGSLPVGLLINEQAAHTPTEQHHVKRVIAEMGGKNAVIVDADADLDEAVKGVVDSAFGYQGQKCSAGSRAIVLEPLYDQFVHRLIEATRSLKVAPAEDPGCSVTAVIDAEARDRIHRMIEQGKGEARLAYAGELGALADQGYYVAPHIFVDVPPEATIAQEEIFGPVLSVLKARDLDHALELANGTKYALTGGIFSRSPQNIRAVKRRFRVGNLYINRKITGALVGHQPFGGFKLSGIGSKAGGPDYLLQFLVPRAVTENTLRHGFAPETVA